MNFGINETAVHWEFDLLGPVDDLRMLSQAAFDDFHVEERDDTYILRLSYLDAIEDHRTARRRAEEIVVAISGAARIVLGSPSSIRIGNYSLVKDDGSKHIFAPVSRLVSISRILPWSTVITKRDRTKVETQPADPVGTWIEVAERDQAVKKALRLRNADDLSWVGLYRIYEVVLGDAGSRIWKDGWARKTDIDLFTRTANSMTAVGDAARHGKESSEPPADPMSLYEARALIDGILSDWINCKS